MVGGLTITTLLAPNALLLLDKPLQKYFRELDSRTRERELRKFVSYMKEKRLITSDYAHGLEITDKARDRLAQIDFNNLAITTPDKWDSKWRLCFFDIPENQKTARDGLSHKLRLLGCYQLQRSVWVHPFSYEEELMTVASFYQIDKYITYVETTHINNESKLVEKFKLLNDAS